MQTTSDKNLTNVNIGVFLKIEDYMQGRLLFE
jgi:hypothetical protein